MTMAQVISAKESKSSPATGTTMRAGLLALGAASVFTLSTFLLQATLGLPEIMVEKQSTFLALWQNGGALALIGLLGLLLSGALLSALSFDLTRNKSLASTSIVLTGSGAGVAWALTALGWLALALLSSSVTQDTYHSLALILLLLYGIVAPLLLALWTLLIARSFFLSHRVLAPASALGLVLVLLRSLVWSYNALVPIEQGYYGTAGLLAFLALPGESLWLVWLFLFGLWLVRR